jgi:signal transduction histidine kinase
MLGGAGTAVVWLPDVRNWSGTQVLTALGLAVLVGLAEQFPISLKHRTETENFSVTDALFPAALLLTGPDVLALAVGLGSFCGQALRRWALYKVSFNAGQHLLGITLAALTYQALDPSNPTAPDAWLAALLAMVPYFFVNVGAVALIIALAEERTFLGVLIPSLGLSFLHWTANMAIGIVAALVWTANPLAVPLVAVPLWLSYFVHREWVRSMREHERIKNISRTAEAISLERGLTNRISDIEGNDEVDLLASTFNQMLDRLEGSLERERRFLGEASHELRSPITICRGHLEVLEVSHLPQEAQNTIVVVLDELGRMGRIVEDMTTLARMEHPELLRAEIVPVNVFLEETVAKAAPLLNGRLKVTFGTGTAVMRADRQRLTQALINLLHNAALHSPQTDTVDLRVVEEERAWRFEVEDRGEGVPEGKEERIFAPFSRANNAVPGSGLGLTIVRAIAKAHGGSAGVDNRPGQGARFWIRVPR